MLSYAKIGKKELMSIIHIQDNYKDCTDVVTEIVPDDELCMDCDCDKYKLLQLYRDAGMDDAYSQTLLSCSSCDNCRKKVEKKVTYYNEANKYGKKPDKRRNAILLFLAYHFLPVDERGFIKCANVKDLAEQLNCDAKTIRHNNELLADDGYILHGGYDRDGDFVVKINGYEDYFLDAKEGGRGYFNLSLEAFKELVKIRNVVALRIYIRQMITMDYPDTKTRLSMDENLGYSKKYRELLRSQPSYCNRSIIKKAVAYAQSVTSLFKIEAGDKDCHFALASCYNARESFALDEKQATKALSDCIKDIRQTVSQKIDRLMDDYKIAHKYPSLIVLPAPEKMEKEEDKPIYSPSVKDHLDFASIAVQYGLDPVRKVLSYLFEQISLFGLHVTNPGGYVRWLLQTQFDSSSFNLA